MLYKKGSLMKCIRESQKGDMPRHWVKLGEVLELDQDVFLDNQICNFKYIDETGGYQSCRVSDFELYDKKFILNALLNFILDN